MRSETTTTSLQVLLQPVPQMTQGFNLLALLSVFECLLSVNHLHVSSAQMRAVEMEMTRPKARG